MSKVICDVCGTAYPETAAQCPICGSAKNSADQTGAAAPVAGEESSGYTYVKGGRFSKRNVRKRNQKPRNQDRRPDSPRQEREPEDKANTGLVIVVVLLLLAIVAVIIYIGVRFFPAALPDNNPSGTGSSQESTAPSQSEETEPSTQPTETEPGIPCTKIELSNSVIMLQNAGDTWPLSVLTTPLDTTEAIVYASSDEKVVTVTEAGLVTAVGPGEAVITVTCGSVSDECLISCTFDSTDPTDPGKNTFEFQFNTRFVDEHTGYWDSTIDTLTWKVYKGTPSVAVSEINWISDDPTICTVTDGILTVLSPGTTKIHAEYGGVTYTCIVRCKYKPAGYTDPTEPSTGNDAPVEGPKYKTNKDGQGNDVTIKVGESFNLYLLDAEGNKVDVVWTAEDISFVTIEGSKITGRAANLKGVKVSTTYEGETYTCLVRISG